MKKIIVLLVTLALLTVTGYAQTATVPTTGDLSAAVTSMIPVAGVCASLGFSLWLYRRMKALLNESMDGGYDNESDDPEDWDDEHRADIDAQLDASDQEGESDFGVPAQWDDPDSPNYAPGIAPEDGWGDQEDDERADDAEEESEEETEVQPESVSEDDEERRERFIEAYCTGMSDEERDNGGLDAAEEAADRLL